MAKIQQGKQETPRHAAAAAAPGRIMTGCRALAQSTAHTVRVIIMLANVAINHSSSANRPMAVVLLETHGGGKRNLDDVACG